MSTSDSGSADGAPAEHAPAEHAPGEHAPGEQARVEQAPVERAPAEQAPGEQAPAGGEETAEAAAPEQRLRPQHAECTATHLVVMLADGRLIATPLWWYPRLLGASAEQRARVRLTQAGVHWPDLDEDLSVAGMLAGWQAPGARPPETRARLALP